MTDVAVEYGILRETIERFSREVLAPMAAELDRTGRSATVHLPALARIGIMGLNLPEAHGGSGLPAQLLFDAVATIAGACASTASMVTAHWLATDAVLIGGDDALCARFLPAAAAGTDLGEIGRAHV